MPTKFDLLVEDTTPGLSAAVLLDFSHVHYEGEAEVVTMISFTAPEIDTSQQRAPLNIVAAVDCSTSMSGPKIHNAKASLRKLVDHLGPNDRLAIIGFHSTVFEVVPSSLMDAAHKTEAHKKIEHLRPNGWTNFSAALLQAFTEIKKVEGKKGCVNRIIMFTDGEPTQGETKPDKLLEMLDKAMIPEISVSTFGYGDDHDTELLSEMSKRGKGNFFFVKEIDQCAAMFGTELGGLLSTYAQNVKVTYSLADGVSLVKVYDAGYHTSGNTVTISDVLGGETKHLMIKVKLPKKTRAVAARASRVLSYEIEYDSVQEARHRTCSEQAMVNYVRKMDEVDTTPNALVKAQYDVVNTAIVLNQAREMADAGNLEGARNILRSRRVDYERESHAFASNLVAEISDMENILATTNSYHDGRSSLISTAHSYSTQRVSGGSLRSRSMFTTGAQASMAEAFADVGPVPSVPAVDPEADPNTSSGPRTRGSAHRSR